MELQSTPPASMSEMRALFPDTITEKGLQEFEKLLRPLTGVNKEQLDREIEKDAKRKVAKKKAAKRKKRA